jgi:hypothetical protein
MSIITSVMQILGWYLEVPAHALNRPLVTATFSFKGSEKLRSIKSIGATLWNRRGGENVCQVIQRDINGSKISEQEISANTIWKNWQYLLNILLIVMKNDEERST